MDTKEIAQETISAFADGELNEANIDQVLDVLRHPEVKEAWAMYHCIGDALRCDDMTIALNSGFSTQLMAKLEKEPVFIAPASIVSCVTTNRGGLAQKGIRLAVFITNFIKEKYFLSRPLISSMSVVAVVSALAVVSLPQLRTELGLTGEGLGNEFVEAKVIHNPFPVSESKTTPDDYQSTLVATTVGNEVIVRDTRIDDYLLAHQRFSPSLYSAAQYTRSATFVTDSNK